MEKPQILNTDSEGKNTWLLVYTQLTENPKCLFAQPTKARNLQLCNTYSPPRYHPSLQCFEMKLLKLKLGRHDLGMTPYTNLNVSKDKEACMKRLQIVGKAGGGQGAAVPAVHADQDAKTQNASFVSKTTAASPPIRW